MQIYNEKTAVSSYDGQLQLDYAVFLINLMLFKINKNSAFLLKSITFLSDLKLLNGCVHVNEFSWKMWKQKCQKKMSNYMYHDIFEFFLHCPDDPKTTGGSWRETERLRGEGSGYRKDHKRRNRY